MGILFINTDNPGQIQFPNVRRVKIISSDNLATVTAAGYLNPQSLEGYVIYNTDIIDMWYSAVASVGGAISSPGTLAEFTPSIVNGVITLVENVNPGNVLLPVVSGDIAIFNGTTGQIKDSGVSISGSSGVVPIVVTPTIANHIATYTNTTGTLSEDAATAINGGNLQAGLSGTAGTVASFPATAANGSLILAAVNAGGAFTTTISNGTMGQSTVYTMGDIGATTGGLVVATSAIRMKSVAQAAVAGGAAAQTVTDTFCTIGSMVTASWNDTTNAVSIQKVAAGNGSFVVTSSADPGASHLNYIITK